MPNIFNEAEAARTRVASAALAISTIHTGVRKDIGNGMLNAHAILTSSVQPLEGIMHKHQKRHLSLQLFQSSSSKALELETAVNDMLHKLNTAIQAIDETHSISKIYHLKALDLPHLHIQPARDSVKRLRQDVSSAQHEKNTELRDAAASLKRAKERTESARRDICTKKADIDSLEREVAKNRAEVSRLESEKWMAEFEKKSKAEEAERLRRWAKDSRFNGKLAASLSFGISLLFTDNFDNANKYEDDARQADKTSTNLGYQLTSIQSQLISLESQANSLKQAVSQLEATKMRLDEDYAKQLSSVRNLERQIEQIRRDVQDSEHLLANAGQLDGALDFLSGHMGVIRQQLLNFKQKLDGLKATLEESRDRSVSNIRKGKKLATSKERREHMLLTLAYTGIEVTKVITEVVKRYNKLQIK